MNGENPKVKKHKEICLKMNETYAQKNSDYGDSFAKIRNEYGNIAILIRLEDKLNRLKTLMLSDKEIQVKDENITDTLEDLANYAIMEIVERSLDGKIHD